LEIYRKVNGTVDPVEALELEGDLIKAVHENNLELLKWTISLGADVNGKDFADRPLLIVAIELNHFDIAKELIRNGANVNVQDEQGRTPLMIVFDTTWDTHIVRDLIENGTDVNIKDANGSNILHFACVTNNQNLEVIKQIISKGVDINSQNNDGYTALICATANLSSDIVKELIANGADVNIAGNDGSTALLTVLIAPVAIATAFDIDYALAAKLTGLASEEITEKLTLEQILEKAINKSTLIFNDLIAAGADVNAKLASGNTTLLNAVSSQNVVAVKTLLAKGVDTKAKNSEGLTALDIAEKNENEEIIELLRNL
jgi:serine/threonine-protein phosphatase 6 regulatory ankyrin repeat subunit B